MLEITSDKRKIKKGFIHAIDAGNAQEVEEYLLLYPTLLNARFYSSKNDMEFNAMMRAAEKGQEAVIDVLHENEISPRYDTEAYLLAVKNGHRTCADKLDENGTVRVTSLHIQNLIETDEVDVLAAVMKRNIGGNIISGSQAHGMGLTLSHLNQFLTERTAEIAYILTYAAHTGHGNLISQLEEKGVPVCKAMAYMAGTGQVENLQMMQKHANGRMKEVLESEQLMKWAVYYRDSDIEHEKAILHFGKNGAKSIQKVIARDKKILERSRNEVRKILEDRTY